MIDYYPMAYEVARLYYCFLSSTTKSCKDFWWAKYQGSARMIEIVTGDYPSVMNLRVNEITVYIGDYKAVINF